MIEQTITAEDLTLYALDLLESDERTHVDAMLRKSTAAREELASIRGDLALFGLAAEQHTPPALTRQRLLKQVARERRTVPVEVSLQHEGLRGTTHTFAADRGAPALDRAAAAADRGAPALARRASAAERGIAEAHRGDELSRDSQPVVEDPVPGYPSQAGNGKPLPVRTFPSRSQQMRAATHSPSALPSPRIVQEPRAMPAEPAAPATFTIDSASFGADPTTFPAERQTFSPDPQMFPREARAIATSATAHSVTMFEQHFATDAVQGEPEMPPDPEAYSGRRGDEPADAIGSVQDRFVPSGAPREESFSFSSYHGHGGEQGEPTLAARWTGWIGWVAAAVVAIAAVFALRDDFNLREQVSQQGTSLAASQAGALRAQMVVQTLESPASQHFLLGRTDAAPAPSGRIAYLPEHGTLVFQGSNLETLQPYKTYELWLIPAGEGRQPLPAGLFKPDGHGYATVVMPQLKEGMIAANFGVTIEDEGGSATPTLPILLVGQQS